MYITLKHETIVTKLKVIQPPLIETFFLVLQNLFSVKP
jgi:hypothetical protein